MIKWNQEGPAIDHPFFKCERWRYVFADCCAYLPVEGPVFGRDADCHWLKGSGSIKAYDDEFTKFLDWLWPYMIPEPHDEVFAYTEMHVEIGRKVEYSTTKGPQHTTTIIR